MKRNDIRFSRAAYICSLVLLFCSCINPVTENKVTEKEYHTKTLWNREILNSGWDTSALVVGKYCYIAATYRGSYIIKLDLETGAVLWESERSLGSECPRKIGDYLYLPVDTGIIFVLNDSDGRLAATVRLGETETEAENYAARFTAPVVSGARLFWGNSPSKSSGVTRGLVCLDTAEINFSTDPHTVQTVIPKLVWSNSWEAWISTNILSEDGIIYFLTGTYANHTFEESCILAALDAETGTVVWEQKMPSYEGERDFILFLINDKLLVSEKNLSCLNKFTGDLIYEVPVFDDGSDFGHYMNFDITPHNNFLYYNTAGIKLISVNADTGKWEWHHDASPNVIVNEYGEFESKWFDGYPMICGEKLFILHSTGLRVYNAVNGKFIGVDSSIKSKSGSPIMYNDTLVIFNNYNFPDDYGYMTAVKCE